MRAIGIGLLMALAGCVTTSDVTSMGRDTFMISTDARGGFNSSSELTARSAQKANSYCAGLGKQMLPTSIENQGVRGWTPQENTLMFRCLTANDPDNQRPIMRREPNSVIEVR